ncbi:MAG: hypothetical protein KTR30_16695 [Saprospiraceae bacterium]|nr:hypothetical protein [Saprospiraceae bacterium]
MEFRFKNAKEMQKVKTKKIDFVSFLEQFPLLEPPILLGEDSHHAFSKANLPLPAALVQTYLIPIDGEEPDENTEFIACFRLGGLKDIHAIVYWKASLLNYNYVLVTFDKAGNMIEKRVIAGTFYDGKKLTQSVATIDEDWMISIASGQTNSHSTGFSATESTAYQLELHPDGTIINA